MMESLDSRLVWSERGNGNSESFVGFVQIFSDTTVTTLESAALVAYPVHVILLNVSLFKRQ